MATITLLTDFGTTDSFVGIMKGVILQINPQATIIDISHNIDPQDVVQAAHELSACYRYFPQDTVHVVVVDPGVGSERGVLVMRAPGHTFVAPDNGVLSMVLQDHPTPELVRVTNEKYFLHPVSRTFHGRDIFAPVAAHLTLGLPLAELGGPMSPGEAIALRTAAPRLLDDGSLLGTIVSVDRFGNLITDIDPKIVQRFFPGIARKAIDFTTGKHEITGVVETYSAVGNGQPLVLIGSRGTYEISVNRGSAADLLGLGRGDNFTLRPGSPGNAAQD
jgi:S-adenosylmethionine hydrolase